MHRIGADQSENDRSGFPSMRGRDDPYMWFARMVLMGFALSMDAFAVTIANAFAYPKSPKARSFLSPLAFAVFQGLMPTIGYFIGSHIAGIIMSFHGIITFAVLGIIGAKMIYDGVRDIRCPADETSCGTGVQPMSSVILQALATSIDALAVGVTFAGSSTSILAAASIIALATLASCTIAWLIGRMFGARLGPKAQVIGGTVLIAIGLQAWIF